MRYEGELQWSNRRVVNGTVAWVAQQTEVGRKVHVLLGRVQLLQEVSFHCLEAVLAISSASFVVVRVVRGVLLLLVRFGLLLLFSLFALLLPLLRFLVFVAVASPSTLVA